MRWMVIDLETKGAAEADIELAVTSYKVPANIKDPAKREARREKAAAKLYQDSALLNASPLLCVAAKTENQAVLFNGMDSVSHEVKGWGVLPCQNEKMLLTTFKAWADWFLVEATLLVGHRLTEWDLPKLRRAYVRHQLPLPNILVPRPGENQPVVDTGRLFLKYFSVEHRDKIMISLNDVAHGLGIVSPKQIVDGSKVPALYEQGHYAEILTYCAIDTLVTERAWQLMTGYV
jgi:Predicted 3'-5' exonuclease related to the exonuclease domain of PolB